MTDRYAPPTQAELEDIYRDPDPDEVMRHCDHHGACIRLLELWRKVDCETDAQRAWYLGCADCDEWTEV